MPTIGAIVFYVNQDTEPRRKTEPLVVGSQGPYQWLTSVDHDITSLLRLCPEVVLNKYLAVTSIDGGALRLTEEEKSAGWWTDDARVYSGLPNGTREDHDDWRVAYSPLVRSIHGLPNEMHDECCAGFNEWYVFDREVPNGDIEVFVNWLCFRLDDAAYTWAIKAFWKQMERLNPESYLADGTVLTLATRNRDRFDRVVAALSADLLSAGRDAPGVS